MSDYGDFCREMKEHRQAVKRRMWEENQRFCDELMQLGASWSALPGGMRFDFTNFKVDFWPSSGKWCIVGTNKYNLGPRKMVNEVKGFLADYVDLKSNPELTPQEWARGSEPPPAIQRAILIEDDPTPPWDE